jgi:hypothetical protein
VTFESASPEPTSEATSLPGGVAPAGLPPRVRTFLDHQIEKKKQRRAALHRELRELDEELEELHAMRSGPKPRKKPARVVKVDPALRASITEEELNDLLASQSGASVDR